MFPFKTKEFSISISISEEELTKRLLRYAKSWRFINLSKNKGTISGNLMERELSSFPIKNSFRPILIFTWSKENNERTVVSGYYTISDKLILLFFYLILFGIIPTIANRILQPLLLSLILPTVYLGVAYILFIKEYDWVRSNFLDVINGDFPLGKNV